MSPPQPNRTCITPESGHITTSEPPRGQKRNYNCILTSPDGGDDCLPVSWAAVGRQSVIRSAALPELLPTTADCGLLGPAGGPDCGLPGAAGFTPPASVSPRDPPACGSPFGRAQTLCQSPPGTCLATCTGGTLLDREGSTVRSPALRVDPPPEGGPQTPPALRLTQRVSVETLRPFSYVPSSP